MNKRTSRKIIKIIFIGIFAYLLIPSYIIAIGIKMPFPHILFPPIGKFFLYDRENYSCLEQSEEVERFLESHGIHVYAKSGWRLEEGKLNIIVNATTGEIDYRLMGDYNGHRWIVIDLGFLKIPFDATCMLPINPEWIHKFNVITKDEGAWYGKTKIPRMDETIEIIRE